MKPEDKARELMLIYYSLIPMNTISFAKKCALIAVDELIEFAYNYTDYNEKSTKEYLEKVKKEIEQL